MPGLQTIIDLPALSFSVARTAASSRRERILHYMLQNTFVYTDLALDCAQYDLDPSKCCKNLLQSTGALPPLSQSTCQYPALILSLENISTFA